MSTRGEQAGQASGKPSAGEPRRRHVRVPREVVVRVRPLKESGPALQARTLDISMSGTRLALHNEVTPGAPLELAFVDPRTRRELVVQGVVAWVAQSGAAGRYEAGVALAALAPSEQAGLLRLLGSPPPDERRRHARFKKELMIDVRRGFSLFGERFVAPTRDLSLGGMAIQAPRLLPVAAAYRVRLFLPPMDRPIRAVATVLASEETRDGRYLVRLCFNKLTEADKARLMGFLSPEDEA